MAADRHHAHSLLDRLGQGQLDAVVHLLETMIASGEDGDTLSNAERNAIADADEWLRRNQPNTNEEVLAEFPRRSAGRERGLSRLSGGRALRGRLYGPKGGGGCCPLLCATNPSNTCALENCFWTLPARFCIEPGS
jgi:hypothetical protein